ncbi:MAG: methionyl-tRNA formyltransferase [Oscillospiraceae bacterium]|nr:methionyl-tRNA formyltransferase [Oscillospiraceae bacterium]
MRVVFMGTPDFAVASLARLLQDGYEVVGVFTQPDKPGNRKKMTPPPVKVFAEENGLTVYQPTTLKDGTAMETIRALQPELIVVAAYGKLLPEEILNFPKLGCINVHSSILPKYRGAAPINHAILDGEEETGVTIMYMEKGLDTGDIIRVGKTAILPDEDAQELTARLAALGAETLSEAIPTLVDGTAQPRKQDDSASCYASMLSREMSPIDWTRSAKEIRNQIRGLIPWPCASTMVDEVKVKVFRAEFGDTTGKMPGTMWSVKKGIAVACGDGNTLILTEVQGEGGKRMAAADYLRGHPLKTEG